MTNFLLLLSILLLLTTFGCLIAGIINPRVFTKLFGEHVTRKNVAITFIPAFIIAFMFVGVFAPPVEDTTEQTRTKTQDTTSQQQRLEQEALLQQQATIEAEKEAQEKLEREQAELAAREAAATQQQQSAPPPPPPPAPPQPTNVVKKSRTSICHAPGTTYYNQTLHYTPYDTLEACLNSGGRLPKR